MFKNYIVRFIQLSKFAQNYVIVSLQWVALICKLYTEKGNVRYPQKRFPRMSFCSKLFCLIVLLKINRVECYLP